MAVDAFCQAIARFSLIGSWRFAEEKGSDQKFPVLTLSQCSEIDPRKNPRSGNLSRGYLSQEIFYAEAFRALEMSNSGR